MIDANDSSSIPRLTETVSSMYQLVCTA